MHNQFNKVQRKINVLHSKGEFNSPSTLDVACNVRIREHKLFSLHHNNNFMGEEKLGKVKRCAIFSSYRVSVNLRRRPGRELANGPRETAVLTDMLMLRN